MKLIEYTLIGLRCHLQNSCVGYLLCRFLKSRPNMEDFLGQLLHFQHFRQFINSKIDKLKNRKIERDLFDNEVLAYEEGLFLAGQLL